MTSDIQFVKCFLILYANHSILRKVPGTSDLAPSTPPYELKRLFMLIRFY